MDAREVHPPPGLPPHGMVMGPNSSYPPNTSMMNPNQNPAISSPAARFPFNTLTQPPQSQPQQPKTMESLNSGGSAYDGSTQMRYNTEPAAKKKRGRPRKYTPDGGIALQLAPTTPVPSASVNHGDSVSLGSNGGGSVGGGGGGGGSGAAGSESLTKKHRGRPPGSGKKQLDALGGVGGVGFTPHVITVKAGEDIASKIMAFSQQGPRTVCILSANGAICNVTLRQPAMSGGTVSYEGRYEIISLSGSFLFSENNGSRSRTGGLSVSLAGTDGRVLGGGVAGMLMAASPVQVIVGSFIADGKKQNPSISKPAPSSTSTHHMLNFGSAGAGAGAGASASPPSQGGSSESSDDNGGSPPLNRGGGFYGNATPIHNNNSQMYPLWSSQAPQ